jgi:formylglycine-generating enzyme required for sulfatase activity
MRFVSLNIGADGFPGRVRHLHSGIELVLIPGGTTWFGSPPDDNERFPNESVPHQRSIESFYLAVTPVTAQQWRSSQLADPSHYRLVPNREEWPVETVCHGLAERFLQALGDGLRLPDEWEWECACRGGTAGARYDRHDLVAWAGITLQPVGRKKPNAYGVYDTLGMVWEWTSTIDEGAENARIARGGSFQSLHQSRRAPARYGFNVDYADRTLGVRVAANVRDVMERL